MAYQRGMDLEAWVQDHAGVDVIVRCALVVGEVDEVGNYVPEPPDFDNLVEETGRLVGIVDGLLLLDRPVDSTSMPLPELIRTIRDFNAETGKPAWCAVVVGDGYSAAPTYLDPELVVGIDVDHEGVGRLRREALEREVEAELEFLYRLADTQPCYLCGRMVERGKERYDILEPEAGRGEEGDPDYIPCDRTWKVVCSQHL